MKKPVLRNLRACAVLAAAAAFPTLHLASPAGASTKTFNSTGTNWNTNSDWTPAGVPTSTDDVLINAGTLDMRMRAADLTIQYITFSDTSSRLLGNDTSNAVNSTLTLNGSGANPLISVTSASSTFTLKGPNNGGGSGQLVLALNASGDFNVTNAAATLDISSNITQTGGTRSINKTGDGTLKLSGSNTFTGGLSIAGGIVQLGSTGALNSTTPNVVSFANSSTGTLRLNGNNVTVGGLSTGTPAGGIVENNAATNATLTVNRSTGTDVFAGTIRDGSTGTLGLTKTGGSTLTLASGGTFTYTGATSITGGTLSVNGTISGAGANVAVGTASANSGTLTGTGTVSRTVDVNAGGTVSAGTVGTVGTLSTGSQNWTVGATYVVDITDASAAAGSGYDTLNATSTINLNATNASSGAVTVKLASSAAANFNQNNNYTWTIAHGTSISNFNTSRIVLDTTAFTDDNPATGTFSLQQSGGDLQIRYTSVPEPGSIVLLGVAATTLTTRRRRRHR